ncbi:hypothetical protein ACFW9F_30155, partial [Streptomyces sp. NPDC059506]
MAGTERGTAVLPFTEARARSVLAALRGADAAADSRLVAFSENAVFALPDGQVAKVGRSAELLDRARHELRGSPWGGGRAGGARGGPGRPAPPAGGRPPP